GTTFNIPSGLSYYGLAPGDVDYLYLVVWLPTSAGNEFQELSQRYAVVLTAVQPAPSGIAAAPTATPFATRTATPTSTSSPTRTATVGATATATPTPDAIAPVVTSIILAGGAQPQIGAVATMSFTVNYSEPVRSVSKDDFAVVIGGGVSGAPVISEVIGAAATWKVTLSRNGATGNHGDTGNASIRLDSVANRTAQDDLGNKVAVVTTGASYFLDTTGPTYIVAYSRPSPASTGPFTISVTSNEPLRAPPRVSINQPGSGDVQEADTQIGAGTNTFTYSLFTIAAANGTTNVDGTATVSVTGTDTTGNVGTTITSGATFTIDTTPPAITLAYAIANAVPNTATASGLSYDPALTRPVRAGEVVVVRATASDASPLASPVTLALSGGRTIAPITTYAASDLVTYHAYTVASGQDGTATVGVTAPDVAGNAAVAQGTTSFSIDTVAPTVALAYAITSVAPASRTDVANLNYEAAGSAPARPVKAGEFVVVRATTVEATALAAPIALPLSGARPLSSVETYTAASSVGDTYHRYDVLAGQDGTASVTVSLADTATNPAVVSGATAFDVDTTAPTATIAFSDGGPANAGGPYKSGDTVVVTATVVEAVGLQGAPTVAFTAGTWTAPGGVILPNVPLSNSGSGLAYSGSFTVPDGNGTVSASIGATDTATNVLSATGLPAFTIDNVAPTAALTYSLDGTAFANPLARTVRYRDTVAIRATFTEANGLQGTPTITLTQAGDLPDFPSGAQPLKATGDPLTWTSTYTVPSSNNGSVTASVSAFDRAGNALTTAPAAAFTVVNDTIPPTVLSTARTGAPRSSPTAHRPRPSPSPSTRRSSPQPVHLRSSLAPASLARRQRSRQSPAAIARWSPSLWG
ncbi:MAG: hypothetical protein ACKO2D_11005, partial [Chloroflexota bacterium]